MHEKNEKKTKYFLTLMIKKSKRVLTTQNNRVKNLIVDENKRRKLYLKKRWICAIDFLFIDVNFVSIDFII